MTAFQSTEQIIATSQGNIFVKTWQPTSSDQPKQIPILLFHDSLGCVQLWRDFPEQLCMATQRTVIAYDRLGFGKSDALTTPLSMDFIAQEAQLFAELLQLLAIPQVINFGHSVGGGMALSCAAQYPTLCSVVITEAAQSFVEEKTLASIRAAKQGFQQPEQLQRLAKYHGDKAQWVLDAWTETWLAPAFRSWNLDAELAVLQGNLLVIHGEHDEYATLEQPKRLAQYANAELQIIAGCGHVPHKEQPQHIIDLVQQFVAAFA